MRKHWKYICIRENICIREIKYKQQGSKFKFSHIYKTAIKMYSNPINVQHGVDVVQWLSLIWLCNPMDCSMSGFPVLHYLLEFVQTHVHWVSDALPISSCHSFFFLPSIFPSIKVFSNELAPLIRWPKYNGIIGYQSGKCYTWIMNLKNQASKMQRVGARYPRNSQWEKSKIIHVVTDYTSVWTLAYFNIDIDGYTDTLHDLDMCIYPS